MLGNDLDNAVPPRILVHLSAVFQRSPRIEKTLGLFPRVEYEFEIDMRVLADLIRYRDRGVLVYAFVYSGDGWPAEYLWGVIDDYYHPFLRMMEFHDVKNLSEYLAYNRDVLQVVDPLHPMAFGSKSLGQI